MRLTWLVGLGVLFAEITCLGAAQEQSFARDFLKQYCVGCHNARSKVAGLELDAMDVANVSSKPEVWEKAVRKLRARTMPPMGAMRPSERVYENMVSYLETSLDRLAATNPNPGVN